MIAKGSASGMGQLVKNRVVTVKNFGNALSYFAAKISGDLHGLPNVPVMLQNYEEVVDQSSPVSDLLEPRGEHHRQWGMQGQSMVLISW